MFKKTIAVGPLDAGAFWAIRGTGVTRFPLCMVLFLCSEGPQKADMLWNMGAMIGVLLGSCACRRRNILRVVCVVDCREVVEEWEGEKCLVWIRWLCVGNCGACDGRKAIHTSRLN